jgi:hypothetical protein
MKTLLFIITTAFEQEQEHQATFIDFDEVELTGELVKPSLVFIQEPARPEADLLILDIRQFVLDKEAAENNKALPVELPRR